MQRRSLLAALPSAFAGCSVAPTGPSTSTYPASQPNVFVSFDWDRTRSELTIRFERGNQLTAANTALLAVRTETETPHRTVWVATDDVAARGGPVDTLPLSPGARVTHGLPEPAPTRLVWTAPDRDRSRVIAQWNPPSRSDGRTARSVGSTKATRRQGTR